MSYLYHNILETHQRTVGISTLIYGVLVFSTYERLRVYSQSLKAFAMDFCSLGEDETGN